ncbi:hypothetical protein N7468_005073 [Penicillium chermesinum]|uniref:Uncharacterized protein n=1 Tax=Penicillium chermesinum TaxID=63820 RepID=A0A9W9TMU7_9EURO|nr:uncharacterized protein N7468_005073 [Penicillium chermesinum]KAJ5232117.1 hypothetical protein N7468_005073 [Penicillium chermesinum]KAJ6171782.1 hypothetical protein N7470_000849 [Penicillium chermesinum]
MRLPTVTPVCPFLLIYRRSILLSCIYLQAELEAFQAKHFGHRTTLYPSPDAPDNSVSSDKREDHDSYQEFYPDGTKRTITDEQIKMFRHSEIFSLLREREPQEDSNLGNSDELEGNTVSSAGLDDRYSSLPTNGGDCDGKVGQDSLEGPLRGHPATRGPAQSSQNGSSELSPAAHEDAEPADPQDAEKQLPSSEQHNEARTQTGYSRRIVSYADY